MKYPILFSSLENENNYQVIVPDIPGCKINCSSMEAGFDEIKMAIEDHLTILAEYGEAIPNGKKIDVHQSNFKQGVWGIIDIDITPYLGRSHKINVTLPELLIKQIDDRVSKSQEHKTRSGFIAAACLSLLQK